MIRVLLAEDQHLIRGALAALLSLEQDVEVVAELDRGDQILPTALRLHPDVAVLDIDLPGLDGLSAAELPHQRLPGCRTLVLTGLSQPGNLLRALQVHVGGFIVKDAPAATLADGIRRVAAGERVLDPELVAAALETGSTPLTPARPRCCGRRRVGAPPSRSRCGCRCRRRRCVTTCPTPSARSVAATASTPSASPATPAGSERRRSGMTNVSADRRHRHLPAAPAVW